MSSQPAEGRPRGPRSGMRGRFNDPPDVQLSKTLSYILRHGADKEGLKMRKDGYIKLDDLLARPKMKGVEVAAIRRVVMENAKQRFTLTAETGGDGRETLWIRANQGHSVEVEALQLEPITRAEDLPVAVHGTYERHWPAIKAEGLKTMNRTHVHLASGLLGESGVISGMRASCNLFIYLDVPKCLNAGIAFFRSSNGVILTTGLGDTRAVPKEYFAKVVTKGGSTLLSLTEAQLT